jgi:hypothetical protein
LPRSEPPPDDIERTVEGRDDHRRRVPPGGAVAARDGGAGDLGASDFRIRDKVFATLSDDGRQATVKATRQEQAALVAAGPETFDIPAYVGRHGWVGVRLATADPLELAELLIEAWRQTAPNAWSRPTTPPNRLMSPGREPSVGSGIGDVGSG